MRPGDRLICMLLDPRIAGHTFKEWPLHITLVPWFRLDMTSKALAEELKEHYVETRSFTVTVGPEVKFGYKKQKLVNVVSSPMLLRIEGQTRRELHKHNAWVVDEADKTRHFRPHITAQATERANEGDTVHCDKVFIVSQHGNYKSVDAEIIL